MTVFAEVWNAAYEGLPPDNENISLGASRIRAFKVDFRQRFAVDHAIPGTADDGKHNQSTYLPASVDPTLDPTNGAVYSKAVGGNTELFYKDSAGNVVELTKLGAINASPFPSGTLMLFAQAAPPAGWTQSALFNDQVIRVVNGGGGGATGGSWTISGTGIATVTNTSISAINMNITINPVTLSAANLPPHTHNVGFASGAQRQTAASGPTDVTVGGSTATDNGPGSSTAFTPTGSASFVSGTASSASSSSFTNDGTWRPAYANVICAGKN